MPQDRPGVGLGRGTLQAETIMARPAATSAPRIADNPYETMQHPPFADYAHAIKCTQRPKSVKKSNAKCNQRCNNSRQGKNQGNIGVFDLSLRGPFRLRRDDGATLQVSSKKGRALLAVLACSANGVRTRAFLQDILWGSRGLQQAQASLRRELSNLAGALGDCDASILAIDRDHVALDLAQVRVDVLQPAMAAHRAVRQAEFLEGLDIAGEEAFEDWLRLQRASLALPPSDPVAIREPDDIVSPRPEVRVGSKPSVAVLPFLSSLTGADRLQLADALVEEITLSLSRYSSLFVIAAGTSLSYRGSAAGSDAIGQDLGVRYLVEGTVRVADDRIRATVKLIDRQHAAQIWADRFEDHRDNFFELQDRVADAVAARIDSSIEKSERAKALTRPVTAPEAYDLYWQANALFRQWDRASIVQAIALCERVVALEPGNAWAYALAGFCHATLCSRGWSADPDRSRRAAIAAYEQALTQNSDDPVVLGYVAGTLVSLGGDLAMAERLVARALEIQPMSSSPLSWGGWIDVSMGNAVRAVERMTLALEINPRSGVRPLLLTGLGLAHLSLARLDLAIPMLVEANELLPNYPVTLGGLSVALALSGRAGEAANYVRQFHAVDGRTVVEALLHNPKHRELFAAGIALAENGMAEAAA